MICYVTSLSVKCVKDKSAFFAEKLYKSMKVRHRLHNYTLTAAHTAQHGHLDRPFFK